MSKSEGQRINDPNIAFEMAKTMDSYVNKASKLRKPRPIRDRLFPGNVEKRMVAAKELEETGEAASERVGWKLESEKYQVLLEKEKLAKSHWRLLSETIRQEVLVNQAVVAILLEACSLPVDATLPLSLLEKLNVASPRISKLFDRYADSLVPLLSSSKDNEHEYKGVFAFQCARDLKLLALTAEMVSLKDTMPPADGAATTLPSGVRLTVDGSRDDARADLLNPFNWEKRQVLQHRVSKVVIKGKSYILKERRTNEYETIIVNGFDINKAHSSEEEYNVAKLFQHHATVEKDRIRVRFETPVGCVIMPDGYQFALFEEEPDFEKKKVSLEQTIGNHREEFDQEYQRVSKISGQIAERATTNSVSPELTKEWYVLQYFEDKDRAEFNHQTSLSYNDFVSAKAEYMRWQAEIELRYAERRLGYVSQDKNEHLVVVRETPHVALEVIGYDLEFMLPEKGSEEKAEQNYKKESKKRLEFIGHDRASIEVRTAYLAMLINDGILESQEIIGITNSSESV